MSQNRARSVQEGFTLIEILIAFTLVIVMVGTITFAYRKVVENNRKKATIASLRSISNALDLYKDDVNEYPDKLLDLVKESGQAIEGWGGPYITTKNNQEPKDSWGRAFYYMKTPDAEHSYELSSYGPNGKSSPKSQWIDVWKQ
jgi:general secretion pathway protein G